MKKVTKIFIFAFLVLAFSIAANAQTEWLGIYQFDEDGGKTVGGTAVFVTHQIDILESDDGLIAMIQSAGYQTSIDLVAITKIEGNKISFYFESYGENNMFETYKKGDLLFTFERKNEKGKPQILTYWDKFQPIIAKNEKSGKVYFQKAENK